MLWIQCFGRLIFSRKVFMSFIGGGGILRGMSREGISWYPILFPQSYYLLNLGLQYVAHSPHWSSVHIFVFGRVQPARQNFKAPNIFCFRLQSTNICNIFNLTQWGLLDNWFLNNCKKKIPSEMEVAPRYNCWHCWHCLTLFDTVDMTYNE